MNNDHPYVIEAKNISKSYQQGKEKIIVFENVDFSLKAGEIIALLGPSGSGKTSFLNILGMLDNPNKGKLSITGVETIGLSDNKKTALRGKKIGFVFQFHNLLPDFTALENVMIPQLIHGINKEEAKQTALYILDKMGLANRIKHFPAMLSGGEQQRVAIARSICLKPAIIIADEPTGNMDRKTANNVFSMLIELIKETNTAIILATHDLNIANLIDNKISLQDKNIQFIS
ncbi:ABC transporter ATP-binding protein [Candidatus Hepatincolaceae symbiont of Richtersius coronifer]